MLSQPFRRSMGAAILSVASLIVMAAAPAWSPEPWLADLQCIRIAVENDYPNLEWLTGQREVVLDRWFDRAADAIRQGHDDADARRAFDNLIERFGDGHMALRWPTSGSVAAEGNAPILLPTSPSAFCAARGYDAEQVTMGTAAALPGYRSINGGEPFAAGLIDTHNRRIGVIRIGVFSPMGYPALCEQALADTQTAFDRPCDDACDDRLLTKAYDLMTSGLMQTVERLRREQAHIMLIDLTRNGGGTEWAEAAARILSPVPIQSEPTYVLRGEAWVKRWRMLADELRTKASKASPHDRSLLIDYAARAEALADEAKPCTTTSACPRLVPAGFSSGLLAQLPAGSLDGREWAAKIFSPAQFPYRDHVWKGPVILLVDDQTWSAAEQFAALMQDNGAAIIMETRTGGAGCGHINGNDPVTLPHSGAQLDMPNCARFRKDGSNEVSGVIPDEPTGVRWNDGPAYAGRLTAAHLQSAIAKAEALAAHH